MALSNYAIWRFSLSGIFNNIKKKYLTNAIVIGTVGGICFGLLLVGIVLLSLKLSEIDLHLGYYFLIGFGAAVLFGVALFLILRPTDRKIAKKLDREYDLHEKVQTMIAYRNKEGDVIAVQREDASERLINLPKKRTNAVHLIKLAALPVVSLAIFFAAVFVPGTKPEPVSGNTLKNWQITAVSQLIDDVNKSALIDSYKTATVGILQGVKDELTDTESNEADIEETVLTAITEIDTVFAADSYAKIAAALHDNDGTEKFALAIENGVESYRLSTSITTYERVKERAETLEELVASTLDGYMAIVLNDLTQTESLSEALSSLGSEIDGALSKSGVSENDALYTSLKEFADVVVSISTDYDDTVAARQLEEALDSLSVTLTTRSLYQQSYHRMMREFVRERLAEIFGIDSVELPGNSTDNPGGNIDNPGNGGDKEGTGGGYGRGDILYGSESVIYDPYEDEFVIYGKVINDYYAMLLEQLANGTLSEEEESLISDYFSKLYSGIEDAE